MMIMTLQIEKHLNGDHRYHDHSMVNDHDSFADLSWCFLWLDRNHNHHQDNDTISTGSLKIFALCGQKGFVVARKGGRF